MTYILHFNTIIHNLFTVNEAAKILVKNTTEQKMFQVRGGGGREKDRSVLTIEKIQFLFCLTFFFLWLPLLNLKYLHEAKSDNHLHNKVDRPHQANGTHYVRN